MKNVLHTLLLIAVIPLIALALEPTNPQGFCDRFLGEKDVVKCKERTQKEEVDWYAATVCNLQKEDSAFWSCWDSIKGQSFNPASLDHCGEDKDLTDAQRQECIVSARAGREPASSATFQALKITK
ncbi:hypothetical protein [Bdellovibrio svalbardensis]|uniref:Uncharacterized protein n=1 Tax=Bdellovibrio svalbardensis TaxID=2972972 RepID=A0ABT6DH76_9BACT|nr:hypothetical protein [Bdellovibrio svalbardensis]MDG0816217.1 hypothetical protein [Bdellovibrio svalbardensis]